MRYEPRKSARSKGLAAEYILLIEFMGNHQAKGENIYDINKNQKLPFVSISQVLCRYPGAKIAIIVPDMLC